MRAFLLNHATPRSMPCHRAEGLGVSLTLHFSFFVLLAGAPAAPGGTSAVLAVTSVDQVPGLVEAEGDVPAPRATEETPADAPVSRGAIRNFALALPDFEFDITKVDTAENLFPFLTDSLPFLDETRERYRAKPDRLVNPFGRERRPSEYPALVASDAQVQQLVDRAWSRRERWSNFTEIAKVLRSHDPQDGDAHLVVRQYLDQNLLQPYYDSTTRDPRFWVMLGLAADHARLIEFIAKFVRDHPSSRTTTELLFMLDEFTQASRDTLLMLLSTDVNIDLNATQKASRRAYQIAVRVANRYDALAHERGLRNTKSIRTYFDDIRLRILATIRESTPAGYGESDARFLAGRILWDQNKPTAAFEWWSELGPDGRNMYAVASTAIIRELAINDDGTAAEIGRILGNEYRRWLDYSEQRLREFGYEFDTF